MYASSKNITVVERKQKEVIQIYRQVADGVFGKQFSSPSEHKIFCLYCIFTKLNLNTVERGRSKTLRLD